VSPETADLIAADAGLVRLASDTPGIRRRRSGRGFSYRRPDGTPVDGQERARIASLAIPPAWTDVWIAPDENSHVLATGTDAAGRKQYLYHPRWREGADSLKFERLVELGTKLSILRRLVRADVGARDPRVAQCALLVLLVDRTLIRAGSRCYVDEHGTYGATTLLASHVDVRGSTVRLSFTGKGGAELELSTTDRVLAERLGRVVATLDDDEHVFGDDDGRAIDREEVNDYLRRFGPFTVKDLRTWGATSSVTERLARTLKGRADLPDAEADAAVRDAIAHAAEALGNTPTVCRASYVAPAVIDGWYDGRLADLWRSSRRSRWLSRAEWTTRRLLTP
jgi:DNA topoisomerase-1